MEHGQKQLQQQAPCHGADETRLHAGGAVFIHGAQQQERVQRKPVTVIGLAHHAVGKTGCQDHAQAQCETCFKGVRPHVAE